MAGVSPVKSVPQFDGKTPILTEFLYQIVPGHITLEVWNKDLYGTDDFMGCVDIALENFHPPSSNSDAAGGSGNRGRPRLKSRYKT